MTPTAATHAIVISPGTKVVSVPTTSGMAHTGDVATLPNYAVGLFDSNGSGPRKRKRLTHLTPEEKIMRRKLKNRVAAQTARDRKRLKMETLEETVQKVQQQAKELLEVNMKLLERAEALEQENAELRQRLGLGACSNTGLSGNRQTVERIKVEFNDAVAPIHAVQAVPDCMLSPDESADEIDGHFGSSSHDTIVNDSVNSFCLSANECASPKPAAGSCQTFVDPLECKHDKTCSSVVGEGCQQEDDILGLLESIGVDYQAGETKIEPSTSGSVGLDDALVSQDQVNSLKDLINVDHLYSKPIQVTKASTSKAAKPSFRIQLSNNVPSTKLIKQPSSPLITVDLTVKRKHKPTALLEDNIAQKQLQTVQLRGDKLALPNNKIQPRKPSKKQQPMLCDVKIENDSLSNGFNAAMDTSDLYMNTEFDAELDSFFNDQCSNTDVPLLSPLAFDKVSSSLPSDSDSLSISSPQTIDTPSLSDILDPFDSDYHSSSFMSDNLTTEPFPQLAAVI